MIYFKKRPLLFLTGILILWILLCHFAGIREQFPYPQSFDGKQVSCTGRVCQIEAGADFWYVYADHIQADFMEEVSERLKVRAILEEPADCAYGNRVQICGKLTLAEAPSNDGAFDRLFYQQTERLLFSMKNARLTVRDGRQNPLLQWMYEVRRICMRHLEQIFDEQDAGILAAMLLGDKSRLDEEIRDWYQVGGIAHVLAISGLHISLFGMALYHILRNLGISFVVSSGIAGSFMLFYAVFTGAGVSTRRAMIMFLLFLGAQCLGRTYDLLSALSAAVFLLLFDYPILLFSSGFQMSVSAVAAIGGFYPILKKHYGSYISSGAAIQLFMLPCVLWHSFSFPLYSVMLNSMVIPLLPFVLAGGCSALLFSFFSLKAASYPAAAVHGVLNLYSCLCRVSLELPFSQMIFGRPKLWSILLYYVILSAGAVWLLQKKQKKVCYLVFVFMAIFFLKRTEPKAFSVTFLDVGQGDGIVLRDDTGVTMLCDGGSSSVSNVGKYRILPYLRYHGIDRLDYVFLSHMDMDHINGVRELLERQTCSIKIKNLVLPAIKNPDETYLEIERLAAGQKIAVHKMREGDCICTRSMMLTCLAPKAGDTSQNKNETSMVLHVKYKSFDVMLMGDLEKEGEKDLIRRKKLPQLLEGGNKIEVLKAGHHGSKGATSEELLDILKPQMAVLSYGKGNRYGHPAPETIERLEKANCPAVSTEKCGEITFFCLKNEKILVRYGKNVIK